MRDVIIDRLLTEVEDRNAEIDRLVADLTYERETANRLRDLLCDLLVDCENWGCLPSDRYLAGMVARLEAPHGQ